MLARMLAENEQLRELARTPLWLDVMTVAYGGDDTATAPKTVTTGDIFDAYIRRVLLEHRQPLQEWSPAAVHALAALAGAAIGADGADAVSAGGDAARLVGRRRGAEAVPIGGCDGERWLWAGFRAGSRADCRAGFGHRYGLRLVIGAAMG